MDIISEFKNKDLYIELHTGKAVNERKNAVANKSAAPVAFEDIFGDLSNYLLIGGLNLEDLNLNSLKGCPKEIQKGFFSILKNPALKTLEHLPKLSPGHLFSIDLPQSSQLSFINPDLYKRAIINVNVGKYKFPEDIDMVINFSNYRKATGGWNNISLFQDSEAAKGVFTCKIPNPRSLEYIYSLYKKVAFDKDKLKKLLELL